MNATLEINLETRFNQLLEFFGNSLDEISLDIENEKKAKANKLLPIEKQEICRNCVHNEKGFCLPHSQEVETTDTCEDCEVT